MCRLFGLTAGRARVSARFWLLDAPDSLTRQSHANPDGTGLGTFDADGMPVVEKQPLAAFGDPAFVAEAKERESCTFVAHVRFSSGTSICDMNTHPFTMDGRIFAHNGEVRGIDRLEAHLAADLARVAGDTDSERVFALITREVARAGGDVEAGIRSSVAWLVENVDVVSLNFVLTTPHELWALRLPAHHELWISERAGEEGEAPAVHRSELGMKVVSSHLTERPSVVVASERLDEGPWRLLDPGELVHVDADLQVHSARLDTP